MNWRDLMAAPPEILNQPHNTQNTQNRGTKGIIAHSADIADRVEDEMLTPLPAPPTQAAQVPPSPVPPIPPLQSGWIIAYMDHTWTLCGGSMDRAHAMVAACHWSAGVWTVTLTDGQTIPLSRVRSVGAVDHKGRLYGAWLVREHGYDGEGPA